MLEHIEYQTDDYPQYCIIWMHGLGADGHDFVPVARELALPLPTRFIFPHAPQIPVTLNGGYVMRAWYDLYSLTRDGPQDLPGIRRSQDEINALIAGQIALGIPAAHVVLAGFSQGGALALHTALRYPQRLAGLIALSTYLPVSATLDEEKAQANLDIPVFMAHGSFDEVIALDTGAASKSALQKRGYNMEWHEYAMAHSVCNDEIADIGNFIMNVFTKDPDRD